MRYVLEIARQTFLLQVRSKLYWILLVLSALFAGIFLFMPPNAGRVPGDELFGKVCFVSAFTLVLPFIVLYLSVYAVHGDIEDRTSVYLFTRPVRRIWILLGKWLAVLGLGSVFATVAVTVPTARSASSVVKAPASNKMRPSTTVVRTSPARAA